MLFIPHTRNIHLLLVLMADNHPIPISAHAPISLESDLPDTPVGRGKKKKTSKPPRKDRQNSRTNPKSDNNPSNNKDRAGPKDTLAMLDAIQMPESVPPRQAQVRNQRIFQSVQTSTLFFFLLALEQITLQINMISLPPTYTVFPILFEGSLFSSLICVAIAAKCAVVAACAVSFKLPLKLGRMYSQISKALTPYFTVMRGVVFARFFGFFTSPFYETCFPSFTIGASSFLMLAAWLFIKHINRVFNSQYGWCRNMLWREIFPTANASKAHAVSPDTHGNTLDTWFAFLTPYADRPDLHFLPVRPYIDHEDFHLTISGYAAAAFANTFDCSVMHKGQMLNPGSDRLLVHHTSRTLVDTYYYEAPGDDEPFEYSVVFKEDMNDQDAQIQDDPIIDPVTNAPHVAGGRFNQAVSARDVFGVLEDIVAETLTRAGSVYYDTTNLDPRSANGRDEPLVEALMLLQIYGGYIMYDSAFLNAFHMFDTLYFSDGSYYQNTNQAAIMDVVEDYLRTFYDMQTYTLELIRGMYTILSERYLSYFRAFGIKIFSVTVSKMTGSTTQLLTYLRNTSNAGPRIFVSPFENGNNLPSIQGSLAVAKNVLRNDVGSILAPTISIERTVATSFVLPEGRSAVAQYLVRKPWGDMSTAWNEPPAGLL